MKLPLLILFLIIINQTALCEAQDRKLKDNKVKNEPAGTLPKTDETSPEPLSLLEAARSAPAEFRADALIRLAESKLVKDRDMKIKLLEEAFDSANEAQFKAKKTVFASINADTKAGYLDIAYGFNLDATSLRSRVVDKMLSLDKSRARDLFSKIELQPILTPLSCEDALIYDVTGYYKTLKKIIDLSFTSVEIKDGQRTSYIAQKLDEISSAVQIGPSAKLLSEVNLASSELQYLVVVFSKEISHLSSDFRTFHASARMYDVALNIQALQLACEKRGVSSAELLGAYREYIIKNLSQEACADISDAEMEFSSIAKSANLLFFKQKPLAADDVKMQRGRMTFEEKAYWNTEKSRFILDGLRKLRFDEKGEKLSEVEKLSLDWDSRFNRVLGLLAGWKAEDEENPEVYLHLKAISYNSLVEQAVTEEQKNYALERFLLFLREFDLNRIRRIEWYWHLTRVLKIAQDSQRTPRSKMLETISSSDLPVLQLYLSLIAKGL